MWSGNPVLQTTTNADLHSMGRPTDRLQPSSSHHTSSSHTAAQASAAKISYFSSDRYFYKLSKIGISYLFSYKILFFAAEKELRPDTPTGRSATTQMAAGLPKFVAGVKSHKIEVRDSEIAWWVAAKWRCMTWRGCGSSSRDMVRLTLRGLAWLRVTTWHD